MTDTTVGTLLSVAIIVLLISSKSSFLMALGIAFAVWRFGMGGCAGNHPIPGVC